METKRAWDALPSLALVNIFCRSSITDRTLNIPLVCRSWASATRDHRCWSSMVSDSHVDAAFLKDRKPYSFISLVVAVAFGGPPQMNHPALGVSRLQTLIRRSEHGGAAVTSLFLYPFVTCVGEPTIDDDVLRLIANRCPELKNLSLYGSYCASEEAILEVIRSCTNLELVDFADSPYFSPLVLEELVRCCPNLRGIRRNGGMESNVAPFIANFTELRLLNLSDTPIIKEDLLIIISGCMSLQYLDVRGCGKFKIDLPVIQRASGQIAEFFYDRDIVYIGVPKVRYFLLNELKDTAYSDSSTDLTDNSSDDEDNEEEACECDRKDLVDYSNADEDDEKDEEDEGEEEGGLEEEDHSSDASEDDHGCGESSDEDDCGSSYDDYDSDCGYDNGGDYYDDSDYY